MHLMLFIEHGIAIRPHCTMHDKYLYMNSFYSTKLIFLTFTNSIPIKTQGFYMHNLYSASKLMKTDGIHKM